MSRERAGSQLRSGGVVRPASSKIETPLPITVCIAENRQSCEPALRILLASLHQTCPDVAVEIICPNASPSFTAWVSQYPRVRLVNETFGDNWHKYDIKPRALLFLLRRGHSSVLWIDSDILIARDFRPLFAALPEEVLALSEEALCSSHEDPDSMRARLWGMVPGRILPFCLNSAVIRVTSAHIRLLEEWQRLLDSQEYREAQKKEWDGRPANCMGDQDVLTALLCSIEFSDVPLLLLRRGVDIIQYFGSSGYTIKERILNMAGGFPPFIHSQGFRPWWPRPANSSGVGGKFNELYCDLSPYTLFATKYSAVLETSGWLNPPTVPARFFRACSFGNPALQGIALAAVADVFRWLKSARRRFGVPRREA